MRNIDKRDTDLGLQHDRILPVDDIEVYLGMGLCQEMVDKGNEIFADNPNIKFSQTDLRESLGAVQEERSFDIYFSTYASMSHLERPHYWNVETEAVKILRYVFRYAVARRAFIRSRKLNPENI